jgi:hypothetical protein
MERWRPYLPDRDVEHVKGMRGTRTTNPPGYVEQVMTIAEAMQRGLPLRQAPVFLFVRGLPVKVEVLRTAYLELFTCITRTIDRITADSDSKSSDPEDKADVLASRMAAHRGQAKTFQRWDRRARQAVRSGQAGGTANSHVLLASVLSALLTGPVAGTPATVEGMTEALTVLGYNDGQDPEHVAEHLATLNFTAIGEAIRSATLEEWETARADLVAMTRFVEARQRVEALTLPEEQQLAGLTDLTTDEPVSQAALIAGLLVATNDNWRQRIHTGLTQMEAMEGLLLALPERFHKYVQQQPPPKEVLQEIAPVLAAWAEQHPVEAEILKLEHA